MTEPARKPLTPPELAATLIRAYGMDPDRALRVAGITARLGANAEPVPGGLIELTAVPSADRPGSWDYTLTPRTGPPARKADRAISEQET
jgi:hypothetical protein